MSIKTERFLIRAKKLFNKGEIIQAKALYKDILKSFPNNKDANDGLHKINIKKQRGAFLQKQLF